MINKELTKRVPIAVKISLNKVASKNTLIEYESKKTEDFDILMEKIKEQIKKPGPTHSEKFSH